MTVVLRCTKSLRVQELYHPEEISMLHASVMFIAEANVIAQRWLCLP